jgi:hypothetical protein
MKKIFRMMLLLTMMTTACVSVSSCSSDDTDGTFSERSVEEYVTGYKWYLDNNKRSEFRFYRNRLVSSMSSGKVTSGSSCPHDVHATRRAKAIRKTGFLS